MKRLTNAKKRAPVALVNSPDTDLARWCEILAEVRAAVDAVPAGWLTAQQIAQQQRKSVSTTKTKLRTLATAGKIESRKFSIQAGKLVRRVTHYRLK